MKIRWYSRYLMIGLVAGICHPVHAEPDGGMPGPLVEAATAYKDKGAEVFLPTLIKGSRLQHADDASFAEANAMLRAVESHYGRYLGIELVGTIPISESTRVVYFVINYERGPLYGVADLYRTPQGEVVTNSNVNTELAQIIPLELIATLR